MRELLTIGLILALLVLVLLSPFITIASVNTLFGTMIPYNVTTWFSSLWLTVCVLRPTVSNSKK